MKSIVLAIVSVFCFSAFAIPTDPVMVGGDANFDACGGWGIATVTTTLFTTNAQGYSEFKVINASQGAMFCDSASDHDGEYHGVVIPRYEGQDCKVSSPISIRQPYSGPCESGWVKKEFMLLIAG